MRANAAATPLRRDVPVEVDPAEAAVGGWDLEELRRLFDFLEFRTLWDRFLEATGQGERGRPRRGSRRRRPRGRRGGAAGCRPPAIARITQWQAGARCPWPWPARGRAARGARPLRGLAFAAAAARRPGRSTVVWLGEALLGDAEVRAALRGLLGEDGVDVSAHDAKALMRGLAVMGVVFSHLQLDTAIAAYLVDPAGDQYLLEDLAAALRRHRAAGARRPAARASWT